MHTANGPHASHGDQGGGGGCKLDSSTMQAMRHQAATAGEKVRNNTKTKAIVAQRFILRGASNPTVHAQPLKMEAQGGKAQPPPEEGAASPTERFLLEAASAQSWSLLPLVDDFEVRRQRDAADAPVFVWKPPVVHVATCVPYHAGERDVRLAVREMRNS